jgi:hypothetical protein
MFRLDYIGPVDMILLKQRFCEWGVDLLESQGRYGAAGYQGQSSKSGAGPQLYSHHQFEG